MPEEVVDKEQKPIEKDKKKSKKIKSIIEWTISGVLISVAAVLIGFRIYPVKPYCIVLRRHSIIDTHMGYDIDILVHLLWRNVPVISEAVEVHYPSDGISNFRAVRDNLHITFTYARLCIGMVIRLPILIKRKLCK